MKRNKFTPTTTMVKNASEGLRINNYNKWTTHSELVELAEKVVEGEGLTYSDVVQVKEWHDHLKDIDNPSNEEITPGYCAYLLSMGAAGKDWADKIMERIGEIKQSQSMGVDSKAQLILLSTNKVRVPLAKKGKWYHDSYGVVEFNDTDFTEILSNQQANRLGFTPYITYGHVDEEPNSTDSHRKRGDLVEFAVQEDVLYGDFSVKEDTYELIKDGEYEFSSGEFIRNFTDKSTGDKVGTAFLRVALTNAPFIPFKEKVQALSQTEEQKQEDCTQTILPFVIGLSINSEIPQQEEIKESSHQEQSSECLASQVETQEESNKENIMKTIENKQEEVIEQVPPKHEALSTQSSAPEEIVTELSQEEQKIEEPAKTESQSEIVAQQQKFESTTQEQPKMTQDKENSVDLTSLVSQVNSLKTLYETQLNKANETIGNLTTQIGEMATKLTAQEAVTQAFSQNMTKAQEQALYRRLSDEGVTPTVIQKFSELKGALESTLVSSTIVKLSTNVEGETKDSSLVEAVADLLISAVSAEPVNYQQFGLTVRKSQAEAFSAGFESIIQRNKELATKRTVG